MNYSFLSLFLLLFLFCPSVFAQNDGLKEDGKLWVVMSDTEKFFYVKGVKGGFRIGHLAGAVSLVMLSKQINSLTIGDSQKKILLELSNNIYKKESDGAKGFVDNFPEQEIKELMDMFYKDEKNRKIGLNTMITICFTKYGGEDVSVMLLEARQMFE